MHCRQIPSALLGHKLCGQVCAGRGQTSESGHSPGVAQGGLGVSRVGGAGELDVFRSGGAGELGSYEEVAEGHEETRQ